MVGRAALLLAALVVVSWVGPATAQEPPEPTLSFTFAIGTLGGGDLQGQPVLAQRFDEDGVPGDTVRLVRAVTLSRGLRGQGSLVVALGPSWRVRLGAFHGRAQLGQTYSGQDAWVVAAGAVPVTGSRDVTVTGAESALRFRIPTIRRARPYLEFGLGAERWAMGGGTTGEGEGAFPGAAGLAEGVTRVAGHLAAGGHYPLTDRLAARAQAGIRIHRTPLRPMPMGTEVAHADTLAIRARPVTTAPFATAAVELVTAFRLDLGLSYSLMRPAPPPPDRSEPDESSSAPDH